MHEDALLNANYELMQKNGRGAAQLIPHVHLNIIPRLESTPRGNNQSGSTDEAEHLVHLMREKILDDYPNPSPQEVVWKSQSTLRDSCRLEDELLGLTRSALGQPNP